MPRLFSGWKVIGETDVVSTRFLRVSDRVVRYGEDPTEHHFTVSHDPDYIQVVALTADGRAVLIEQDHVAEGWSLQCIAGNTRGCASPEEAAQRELNEEGGWRAREWHRLGVHVPQTDRIVSATPGTDGAKRCTMFLALGLSPTPQKLEETEKLRVHLLNWETVVRCALTGELVPGVNLPIMDCGSRLSIILASQLLSHKPRRS